MQLAPGYNQPYNQRVQEEYLPWGYSNQYSQHNYQNLGHFNRGYEGLGPDGYINPHGNQNFQQPRRHHHSHVQPDMHTHGSQNIYNPNSYNQRPLNSQYNAAYNLNYDPRVASSYSHQNQRQFIDPLYQGMRGQSHVEYPPQNRIPPHTTDRNKAFVKQVVYEEQPLNIPQPVRNVQYIPHLNRYMDYVEERVKVPVEKYYTDYYEIQHITDFVPRQYEDTVVQMVPQEIVRYRLEYVPVQRKIVHLPKSQVYDENGLYKGVGNLADRANLNEAAVGIVNQGDRRVQGEISRAVYQNLSNSQISKGNLRGLEESLVNGIARDNQNTNRPSQTNINQALYAGLKGAVGSSNQGQSSINQALYQNVSKVFGSSQSQNLPQNQMINQQLFNNLSRGISGQQSKGRSEVSRKRTSYVTSDGYFPNYEEQLRNIPTYEPPSDYFNESYASNTANRLQSNQAAYNLGQNLFGGGGKSGSPEGNKAAYNLGNNLFESLNQPSGGSRGNQGSAADQLAYNLGLMVGSKKNTYDEY